MRLAVISDIHGNFIAFEAILHELGIAARERHPRDENDYITKQPWASGMPGSDRKDVVNGDAKIEDLMDELERDEQQGGRSEIEHGGSGKLGGPDVSLSEYSYGAPGSVAKHGGIGRSGTNHSQRLPRISRQPKSDVGFWDIIARDNVYMMTGLDEFEDGQDEQDEKSKDEEREGS